MRVTGTLCVTDHRARVRLRRGTLVVEQPGGWQRIPIEALDGVVLTGRAEISNDASRRAEASASPRCPEPASCGSPSAARSAAMCICGQRNSASPPTTGAPWTSLG